MAGGVGDVASAVAGGVASSVSGASGAAAALAVDQLSDLVGAQPAAILGRGLLAFLEERARCDAGAPAADGTGGSGHHAMVVAGIDSKTGTDGSTLNLPVDDLGYRDDEVAYYSYEPAGGAYDKRSTYAPLLVSARRLGAQLREQQRLHPGREVDLLAHSQGGVVAVAFLKLFYDSSDPTYPPLGTVVTFSSPLEGAPAADVVQQIQGIDGGAALLAFLREKAGNGFPDLNSAAVRDLATDSEFMGLLDAATLPDGVDLTTIGSTYDTTVPGDHASTSEARRATVVDTGYLGAHTGILRDEDAFARGSRHARERGPPVPQFRRVRRGRPRTGRHLFVRAARERTMILHLRWTAAIALVATACSHTTAGPRDCTPEPVLADARWSLDLERAPGSAAADADGVVVTMGNERVVAFDRAGGEVWSTRVEGVGLDWPVIADDVVVLPTTRVAGDGDRAACVALDRSTGAERWQVEVGAGPVASVGAGGDTVVCASARGHLAAVGRDGALRWAQDVEAYLGEGPISVSPRGAVAVAPESGRVGIVLEVAGRWKFSCWDLTTGADAGCSLDLGPGAPPSAAAADGSGRFVLGLGAGRDGAGPSLAVIDPGAGLMREIAATAAPFDPSSIPLVTGETAVVVDRLGGVTAVDLAAMELRWRAQLRQPVLDARPVARRAGRGQGRRLDGPGPRIRPCRWSPDRGCRRRRRRDRRGGRSGRCAGGHHAARARRKPPPGAHPHERQVREG